MSTNVEHAYLIVGRYKTPGKQILIDGMKSDVSQERGERYFEETIKPQNLEAIKNWELQIDGYRDPSRPVTWTFDTWWSGLKDVEYRGWKAELRGGTSTQAIDLKADYWQWGYPMNAVAAILDTLHSEGWTIIHVSEDHGIYQGENTNTEAYPTRTRFLLKRSLPKMA